MERDEKRRETSAQRKVAPTSLDPTTIDQMNPPRTDLVGQVIDGRYVIQSELTRGGMGVVYLASDQQLHSRTVVVKVLLDSAYQNEYVVQKFRQEVEALSRIDHPGIVGIIDSGELGNGRPYLVMQYVEGVTLRSVITQDGMNLERSGEIIKQAGRALAAAHNRGIFHRDLKPDNIMLQNLGHGEEQVKIIDFGIAKVKSSVVAPSTSLNLSPGTVAYMAPEQLSGRPITGATDVFALGTIAYEMLTGRKPFNPETGFEMLQMQQAGVRVMPSDLRPSLPGAAEAMLLKALAFNPGDRFSNAREFGDGLGQVLADPEATRPKNTGFEVPPTRLATQERAVEPVKSPRPSPTIQVAFQPASPVDTRAQGPAFASQNLNPSAAQLGFVDRSVNRKDSVAKYAILLGIALLILLMIGGGAIWWVLSSKKVEEVKKEPGPSAPERTLNYGLTVQKVRDGRPYQDPFESSGQEIFENGWRFRMNMDSTQTGYLYLLNEGPADGDTNTYNVLFPAPSTNSGSSYLAANQRVETGWMVFDDNKGTEKFWMIWSADSVPELEAVKGAANSKDKGEVTDPGQSKAIKQFLEKQSPVEAISQKDKSKKKSSVKGNGKILVHRLELEHH